MGEFPSAVARSRHRYSLIRCRREVSKPIGNSVIDVHVYLHLYISVCRWHRDTRSAVSLGLSSRYRVVDSPSNMVDKKYNTCTTLEKYWRHDVEITWLNVVFSVRQHTQSTFVRLSVRTSDGWISQNGWKTIFYRKSLCLYDWMYNLRTIEA